jgi:hypothetical protein
MTSGDDIWDDPFHGAAWQAYLEVAREAGGWPDQEDTRRRAFDLYEEALAAKNAARPAPPTFAGENRRPPDNACQAVPSCATVRGEHSTG